MLALVGMLISALLPTILSNWPLTPPNIFPTNWQPGIPAQCFMSEVGHSVENNYVVISVAFLVTNYATRTARLFDSTSRFAKIIFRGIPGSLLKKVLKSLEEFHSS
jgi:hypothetical protein